MLHYLKIIGLSVVVLLAACGGGDQLGAPTNPTTAADNPAEDVQSPANVQDPEQTPTPQPDAEVTEPEPEPEPEPQPVEPDSADFTLHSSEEPVVVNEGGDTVRLPIRVQRGPDHKLKINLSAEPADERSAADLEYTVVDKRLGLNESETYVKLTVNISVAPLLPHQRSLELTASDGVNTQSLSVAFSVVPVQVPDVYLLVGQSNMEGYSENNAKDGGPGGLDEPHPRILQLNVTANDRQNFATLNDFVDPDKNVAYPRYVQAQDPLHESFNPTTNGKSGRRIGLGLSFAKAALPNTTQDIILVPAAWAGTGFCDNSLGDLAWNPRPVPQNSSLGGTSLYDRAILRINMALEETGGILRGILWHQGEADSTTEYCSSVYQGNLKTLISSFRMDIQPDARGTAARGKNGILPFVLGTMSRGDDPRGMYSVYDEAKTEVDLAHRSIPSDAAFTALSNHDDLVPPAYDCGEGHCIHFGSSAYREMGRRYYQRLLHALEAY